MRNQTPEHMRTKLATAIRLYLAATNQDQKQLAKLWQCSESTVTRFLNGSGIPEPGTMLRIFQWSLELEAHIR